MRDNKSYYNTFAETYDHGRDRGYHGFLDLSEFALVAPHARGREVLEVGCGTGLILARLAGIADHAVGVDLSPGMLEHARSRGLDVHEASATSLPFEDASFDVACSFKVLAHVEDITTAMAEMARVTRPGGVIVAEFYNRQSIRTLVKRFGPAGKVGAAGDTHEREVYTRFDSLDDIRGYLPSSLSVERVDGIRVLSPAALPFDLPVVGPVWSRIERLASRLPIRRFGGFLVVTLRRA
jgi:ubiquinone/menaquinone biosynthesis C-methylase UbiE